MKFAEAVALANQGKAVQAKFQPLPWCYLKIVDGQPRWFGFFDGPIDWNVSIPFSGSSHWITAEWVEVDEAEVQSRRPPSTFNCARRSEQARSLRAIRSDAFCDFWSGNRGYRACSYCGSLHPDDFMKHVREGTGKIVPTDKNYKAYLEYPDPQVGKLQVVGTSNAKERPGEKWVQCIQEHIDTYGDQGLALELGEWILIMPRAATRTEKFYFQHFSQEQMQELISLVNAKKVLFDYPGRFYRLPYFMVANF